MTNFHNYYRIHFAWPGHSIDVTARTADEARRIAETREPDLTVRHVEWIGTRPKLKPERRQS